jgi:hypothetical protein
MNRFTRVTKMALTAGCVAIFILAACGTRPPRESFANMPGILAQAPCVAGICVGPADRENVFQTLSKDDLLYNIRDNGGVPIWFSIQGGGGGGIMFARHRFGVGDEVERIRLHMVDMPLGIVLDIVGEPDDLFLVFGCGRGSHVHGKLFYREKGIEVQVQFPVKMRERATPVILNDASPTQWIWYFDPSLYDEWLLGIYEDLRADSYFDVPRTATAESLAAAVQPWPGMGVPVKPLDLCPR